MSLNDGRTCIFPKIISSDSGDAKTWRSGETQYANGREKVKKRRKKRLNLVGKNATY